MIKWLKRLRTPISLEELAANELAWAEREKLAAQSNMEYQASMVSYNEARIKRLRKLVNERTNDEKA